MTETNDEQLSKNVERKIIDHKADSESEIKIESLPSQEIKDLRKSVIDEISHAERPEEKPPQITKQYSVKPVVVSQPVVKSQVCLEIEQVLEEGLDDIYLKMAPENQKIFKTEGEKAASKIEQLLKKTKVKIKEIIKLIHKWLKLIPGVNHFFLEQEAKIKSDKIIKIKK